MKNNNNTLRLKDKIKWLEEHVSDSFLQEDYKEENLGTLKKKVVFFRDEIKRVAFYPANFRKFNNNKKLIIEDYLQGLPLTIPCYDHDIYKLGQDWGYILDTDKKIEKFI